MTGVNHTLPLAGLLLLVAGIGAISAWFFAAWTGMLNNVEQFSKTSEFEAQQVRIQELETDLNRYRSTVETQLGLLPATTVSASSAESSSAGATRSPSTEPQSSDHRSVIGRRGWHAAAEHLTPEE